jgi:hypothetical protein
MIVAAASTAQEVDFSDAELTLMAFIMDAEYFPATPPPTLDDDGWKAVERGLVARGVVHGRLRQRVADDVAEVLDVVLSAQRSLWPKFVNASGAGSSSDAYVLWLKDDAIVRLSVSPAGLTNLAVCERQAIDAMTASLSDFPAAGASQPGPPVTLPVGDFAEATQVASREGTAAASARFPEAAGFLLALDDARTYRSIESQRRIGPALADQSKEMLTFADSPAHGLWLAHDGRYAGEDLTGVVTRVQRVSVEMARGEITDFVNSAG